MTGAAVLLILAGVFCGVELVIWSMVRAFKPRFQWITTPADIAPEIDAALIEDHARKGFDPELGWVRKPNTEGVEQTESGPQPYVIDAWGCRVNPGFEGRPSRIAAFGDSFAFCRLAGSDETWPFFLSKITGTNVRNFGVGNYGLDQAILRLERELPELDSDVILMIVVPETMARIHSYWKHYYEYGNVLAFKPRFSVDASGLAFHPSAVRDPSDYSRYRDQLSRIQKLDHFFECKFQADVFAFPNLPKVIRRARRHIPILWHLTIGWITGTREKRDRLAFDVISHRNAELATKMYGDPEACALFTGLVQRFRQTCENAGRRGLLVILPQPIDLELPAGMRQMRCSFFENLKSVMSVLDLTVWFEEMDNWRRYFFDGKMGPHLNARGNQLVAEHLATQMQKLFPEVFRPVADAGAAGRSSGAALPDPAADGRGIRTRKRSR